MKLTPRYEGPPVLTIDGSADDQLVPVTRQRRRMETILAPLSDDAWQTPSRCDGWAIRDVIAHLVTVNGFWEMSVRAGLAGEPTRVLATFDPAAHPPLMVEGMRALTPQELFGQFVASNDGFLDALASLDDAGWATIAESPAGHVSIRLLAFHAIWDSWIHERDIALPLGFAPTDEPDEVRSCLRYAAAVSPALTVSNGSAVSGELAVAATEPDDQFTLAVGDSVAVRNEPTPPEAPCLHGVSVDLVEALSVRAPLPADAPAEWRRLLNGLATVFDTELEAGRA